MGKFLFIRGGAVGDFVLTMPAIRLVRENMPDNEIEILGYPAITELALATGLADRTRSIEDSRLAAFFAPGARLDPEWVRYLASFNVVVSYLYDPDGFFADNLKRAGVKTLLEGPFRPDEASAEPVTAATQLARPLERFALYLEDPVLELDYARTLDSPLLPRKAKHRIGIHPGSGSASKNWSFESWVEVLDRVRERLGDVEFVVTSGEAEIEVIGEFLDFLGQRDLDSVHLAGKSLPELGAAFSELDFYLGHDSGISHLAASAGVEGLLLFGPSEPRVWAPASPKMHRLVSSDRSLGGIRVPDVLEALERTGLFTA